MPDNSSVHGGHPGVDQANQPSIEYVARFMGDFTLLLAKMSQSQRTRTGGTSHLSLLTRPLPRKHKVSIESSVYIVHRQDGVLTVPCDWECGSVVQHLSGQGLGFHS